MWAKAWTAIKWSSWAALALLVFVVSRFAPPHVPAPVPTAEEGFAGASPSPLPEAYTPPKFGDGLTEDQLRDCEVHAAKLVQAGSRLTGGSSRPSSSILAEKLPFRLAAANGPHFYLRCLVGCRRPLSSVSSALAARPSSARHRRKSASPCVVSFRRSKLGTAPRIFTSPKAPCFATRARIRSISAFSRLIRPRSRQSPRSGGEAHYRVNAFVNRHWSRARLFRLRLSRRSRISRPRRPLRRLRRARSGLRRPAGDPLQQGGRAKGRGARVLRLRLQGRSRLQRPRRLRRLGPPQGRLRRPADHPLQARTGPAKATLKEPLKGEFSVKFTAFIDDWRTARGA